MRTVFLTFNTSWHLYNFLRSTILALRAQGCRVVCLSPLDDFSQRLVSELGALHIALPLASKNTVYAARRRMEEMFSEERVVKAYLNCLSV